MRRAAERICILEPGPRCDAARSKVHDAERRVAQACPECAPPQMMPPEPPPPSALRASAPRSGGCAGCAVPGEPRGDALGVIVGVGVLAALARRRRTLRGGRR
jgi:hypothetical protein